MGLLEDEITVCRVTVKMHVFTILKKNVLTSVLLTFVFCIFRHLDENNLTTISENWVYGLNNLREL